jgi:hypothetical protein
MDITAVLAELQHNPACLIHPPTGLPHVRSQHTLPPDVVAFYTICSGLTMFGKSDVPTEIVAPQDVRSANPVIAFTEEGYDDISDAWYIIARISNGDYVTMDCDPARLGRCYDSNHETYGLIGQTPIIAASLTDFIERTVAAGAEEYYWLQPGFQSVGDAYD